MIHAGTTPVTTHWWAMVPLAIFARMQPATVSDIEGFNPSANQMTTDAYGPLLATVYEPLASLYSLGAISACRRWGASHLLPGSRVLFAGAGSATEVAEPARRGVQCDLIDSSAAMLQQARRNLTRCASAPRVHYRLADVHDLRAQTYDAVVAHFFLNTFETDSMQQTFAGLLRLLRPGGMLVIGDFAAPTGSRWQRMYHDLPMHLFAGWTKSQPHPIHDMPGVGAAAGAHLAQMRHFRIARVGPAWYTSWLFNK